MKTSNFHCIIVILIYWFNAFFVDAKVVGNNHNSSSQSGLN
jgi:hypothetical protein